MQRTFEGMYPFLPSTMNGHYYWEQWSRDCTVSRKQGSGRPRCTSDRDDHHIRHMVMAHRTASAAAIRASFRTTVLQGTIRNRLLQGQPQIKHLVPYIPLIPSHCRLRHHWC
ncbi:HTH_Tnp_Tc3_2 domain-containing protein [Trichonephila clavipes]|nr:HTH_Tnp_Tc3_2 domain-containing protein [Trichonephila clavipes]